MLATEELRRGRFWPTSSGSRSLKSLVATGVGALHGRGPQIRPWVKNAFMMNARNMGGGRYAYSFFGSGPGRVAFGSGVLLLPPAQETVDPAHVVSGVASLAVSLLLHADAAC